MQNSRDTREEMKYRVATASFDRKTNESDRGIVYIAWESETRILLSPAASMNVGNPLGKPTA